MELFKCNLSQKLIFSLITWKYRKHVIFSSWYQDSLFTSQSSDLSSVSFQNKTKILLLIPNMNSSIGASWVANTIFINHSAWKLGLLEFSSKCSILKKLFACISWIPKLDRSGWDCYESKIIWFSWPLDIENSIVTSWKSKEHFFSLDIINVHVMIIALVDSCDISLTWRDR